MLSKPEPPGYIFYDFYNRRRGGVNRCWNEHSLKAYNTELLSPINLLKVWMDVSEPELSLSLRSSALSIAEINREVDAHTDPSHTKNKTQNTTEAGADKLISKDNSNVNNYMCTASSRGEIYDDTACAKEIAGVTISEERLLKKMDTAVFLLCWILIIALAMAILLYNPFISFPTASVLDSATKPVDVGVVRNNPTKVESTPSYTDYMMEAGYPFASMI